MTQEAILPAFPTAPSLAGKVAFVTGASRGIGRATAAALAGAGAAVVGVARTTDALETLAEEVRAFGGQATAIRMDAADPKSIESAVEQAYTSFGRLDIVVNNAAHEYSGPAEETTVAEWNRIHDVNLRGVFLVCRAAAPMLFDGGGSIVNVGSIASLAGIHNMAAYTASKAGVIGLTKALAIEWAERDVRVNCVCPGAISTDLTAALQSRPQSTFYRRLMDHTPLRRFADPEEVAGAIVFLASDAASFITGAVLSVDGGFSSV